VAKGYEIIKIGFLGNNGRPVAGDKGRNGRGVSGFESFNRLLQNRVE
jgi:hypothetical protein